MTRSHLPDCDCEVCVSMDGACSFWIHMDQPRCGQCDDCKAAAELRGRLRGDYAVATGGIAAWAVDALGIGES